MDFDKFEKGFTVLWKPVIPKIIEFVYVNSDGERTQREILLSHVLGRKDLDDDRIYLYGYCRLRKEMRTFNLLKIRSRVKFRNRRYDLEDLLVREFGIDLDAEGKPFIKDEKKDLKAIKPDKMEF